MFSKNIVIIGSSTGGIPVIKGIFNGMPMLKASFIVVQHMLEFVNQQFANELGRLTDMRVTLAKNGDMLEDANVYVAPSGRHLKLVNNEKIILISGEKVHSVKPSIDVTMNSLVFVPKSILMGIILTGMGKDGAKGIAHMKAITAITVAQKSATCVISSMPEQAIETGKVEFVLQPDEIRMKILENFKSISLSCESSDLK